MLEPTATRAEPTAAGGTAAVGAAETRRRLAALLPRSSILSCWQRAGADERAALALTRAQVAALRSIVEHDAAWSRLLTLVRRARALDSWLVRDWPHGFDELLLCAPLCERVAFDCARCTIGARQGGASCARAETVFGHVGALLCAEHRQDLLAHLDEVDAMLDGDARWDLERRRCAR